MMHTSNQTYKELSIPYFKEVFRIMDKVLTQKNIPYYLIGRKCHCLGTAGEGSSAKSWYREAPANAFLHSL
jgi:hypothetical protein